MRNLLFSLAMFLCVSFVLSVETNFACFIAPPSDQITNMKEYNLFVRDYNRATAIFSGKVIELGGFKVKFRVDKVWKGNIHAEFVMSSGTFPREKSEVVSMSSCSFRFKLGESYLIYAKDKHFGNFDNPITVHRYGHVPEEYRNLLWTSKSGRTKPLAEAEIGIRNLNKLIRPRKMKH
jgi:hypothetical protein